MTVGQLRLLEIIITALTAVFILIGVGVLSNPVSGKGAQPEPDIVAMPFAINAWGAGGVEAKWTDCGSQDGGRAAAEKFCQCWGYTKLADGEACYQEPGGRYEWNYQGSCAKMYEQGSDKGFGDAFTKVKCQ